MTELKNWLSQIIQSLEAIGAESCLGIGQPSDQAMSQAVASAGFPGVLPLWAGRRHIVGLLANPLAAPQAWSAVILRDGEGLTIASDARTLLPQLIVQRVLSNSPESARRLAERWGLVEHNALALHRTLGGADETLAAVVAVANDSEARSKLMYKSGHEAVFEAAHSSLCRKIDQSEIFTCYADWLDACITGQRIAIEDPVCYGAWERRVLCWSHALTFSSPNVPALPVAWLFRVIEGNAGIDSSLPVQASWSMQAGGGSGETAMVEAATLIGHEPAASDSVSAGLARALLTEGSTYRGFAHAEAVVAFDERGEPERAWQALQAAAWWAARNTGKVPDAMLQGARFLADRHGWVNVGWTVERAMTNV